MHYYALPHIATHRQRSPRIATHHHASPQITTHCYTSPCTTVQELAPAHQHSDPIWHPQGCPHNPPSPPGHMPLSSHERSIKTFAQCRHKRSNSCTCTLTPTDARSSAHARAKQSPRPVPPNALQGIFVRLPAPRRVRVMSSHVTCWCSTSSGLLRM